MNIIIFGCTQLNTVETPFGKTWMCTLCSQGFTRRSSARRHNDRLHNGQAIIERPFEYLVGRLSNQYSRPQDPLKYRRHGLHPLQSELPQIAHDNLGTPNPPPPNDDLKSFGPKEFNPTFRVKPENAESSLTDQSVININLQELALLLDRHCTQEEANKYLAWVIMNVNSGKVDILNAVLNLFRSKDGSSRR